MAEDKIVKYRGKTLVELQAMPFEEFCTLLPSNLRRKVKRGFTEQEKIFLANLRSGAKNIKTHCRDLFILPEMVGSKISIYNGKAFVEVSIVEEMIGVRFGELAPSRKIGVGHAGMGAKRTVVRK